MRARASFFSSIVWASMPSHLEDVFSFIFGIKLSCNTGPSLQIFVVMRQNRGNHTLPRHFQMHVLPSPSSSALAPEEALLDEKHAYSPWLVKG